MVARAIWWKERERPKFLSDRLGLQTQDSLTQSPLRYQLLHRAVSAIVEAERFKANSAAMIVHSFAYEEQWRDEIDRFLHLFGTKLEADQLVPIPLPMAEHFSSGRQPVQISIATGQSGTAKNGRFAPRSTKRTDTTSMGSTTGKWIQSTPSCNTRSR